MTNQIVTVNVSQLVAPTPPTLQSTGALISQGATNLGKNGRALLTQLSDLTSLLLGTLPLASLTQVGGLATATLESAAISSGTYTALTGQVSLTIASSIGVEAGDLAYITGATGTGSVTALDGTQELNEGTGGTTLEFPVATGLTMTIGAGGTAYATPGLTNGSQFLVTISGASQAGYNGTFLATITGPNTFTFAVPSTTVSPATGTPVATPGNQAELIAMATTFFAQGASQAVYVLELGAGTATAGANALSAYLTANPGLFYAFLVPRSWDANAAFLTLIAAYEATTSKVYFFVTTTTTTYTNYTALMKCVQAWVEAPGIPTLEFSAAAAFYVALHYRPSSTNKVTPFAFSFLFGVTPYPTLGNSAILATLKTANINVVGVGAEGGISNAIVLWGTMMDGNDFTYWYSVDWVQINVDLAIANAVINGSNNPSNPLYYSQDGINRLQMVASNQMASGVAFGLVLGPPLQVAQDSTTLNANFAAGVYNGVTVINAIPFLTYTKQNPSDFKNGKYAGFTIIYTPSRGFVAITFNVIVTSFVTQ